MNIDELCGLLTDRDSSPSAKCQAADELGRLGVRGKSAVPALLLALKDRGYTADGDSRSASYALDIYKDYVREHAILALAKIDPEATAAQVNPVIAELLKYPREVQREDGIGDFITYVSFPKEVVTAFGDDAQRIVEDVITNPPKGIPNDVGWW